MLTFITLYLIAAVIATNAMALYQYTSDGVLDDVGLARTLVLWPIVAGATIIFASVITLRSIYVLLMRLYYTVRARLVIIRWRIEDAVEAVKDRFQRA